MPFIEPGAEEILEDVVASGMLTASTDPAVVASAENVIVVIGTPVDEHLNPDPNAIPRALATCAPFFRDGQLLVLRSTIYPGVTALVRDMVADLGVDDGRRVLPGAHRRAQGDGRAVRAAADRLGLHAARPSRAPARCSAR